MCAKTIKHPSALFQGVVNTALIVFVFMLMALVGAGAETFFGTEQPLFELMGSMFVGAVIAVKLSEMLFWLVRNGATKLAWAILITIIAFDVAVIPFCRWLIRLV